MTTNLDGTAFETVTHPPMPAAPPPFDPRAVPAGLHFRRWQAPDGWPHRAFDWAPEPPARRGSLLFQSGRSDFAEKYFEPLAAWHRGGWAISGFDWRGQGGSGRLLEDRNVGHLAGLDSLVDDLGAFVRYWLEEEPGPHVLIAH
jgi:lysophospholipase